MAKARYRVDVGLSYAVVLAEHREAELEFSGVMEELLVLSANRLFDARCLLDVASPQTPFAQLHLQVVGTHPRPLW